MATTTKQRILNKPITKQPWTLRLDKLSNDEIIEGGEKWRIGSLQHWSKVALSSGKAGKVVFYRLQVQPPYIEIMHFQGVDEHRQKVPLDVTEKNPGRLEFYFVCDCGNKVRELFLYGRSQTWRCPKHETK